MKNSCLALGLPLVGLLSLSLLGTGCPKDDFDLAGSLPENRAVTINVPGGGDGQALVGQRSDLYDTTYNISRGINGSVIWVLNLVRDISRAPPTRKDGDTRTWGPSEPSGLERISWRFVATKLDDGHYSFKLEGRPKGGSEEDFRIVLDGDITRGGNSASRGHGTLNLYFDKSQELEQKVCGNGNRDVLEGRATVNFVADADPKSVNVEFVDFRNKCDGDSVSRQMAKYVYVEASDGAGNFQFTAHGNIHKASENKPLIEEMTIRSRWAANGAGRSDLTVGEGEIPADMASANVTGNAVVVTECWDQMFETVFQTTLPEDLPQSFRDAIRPTDGQESACQYTEAQLPDAI